MSGIKLGMTLVVGVVLVLMIGIGGGYVLSKAFSLSLYESGVLILLSGLIVVVILGMTLLNFDHHRSELTPPMLMDDDEGLVCEDCAEAKRMSQEMFTIQEKIGRNERCPCGSGKKYKNCCLSR